LEALVEQLQAEIARLRRKQFVGYKDLLRPKAASYCYTMTGLSQAAVQKLWERYQDRFADTESRCL
jgi:hypothetical protein